MSFTEKEKHSYCLKCGGGETIHKQRHIEYNDYYACVDEEMAELILILWKNGIETMFSCKGETCTHGCGSSCYADFAQILFRDAESLEKFYYLLRGVENKDFALSVHINGDYRTENTRVYLDLLKKINDINNPIYEYLNKEKIGLWKYEISNKISDIVKKEENEVEGLKFDEKFRDKVRWNLTFPTSDIQRIVRYLKNDYPKRRVILTKNKDNKEDEYFGALAFENNKVEYYGDFRHGVNKAFNENSYVEFLKMRDDYGDEIYAKLLIELGLNGTEESIRNYMFEEYKKDEKIFEDTLFYNPLKEFVHRNYIDQIYILEDKNSPTKEELELFNYRYFNWQEGESSFIE